MTPLECERIFDRIEEYKRSIEKYIRDVASLVEKVSNDVEEDPWIELTELDLDEGVSVMDLDEGVSVMDLEEGVSVLDIEEGELGMDLDEGELGGADEINNNEDLADFLIETFDLDF